MSYEIYIGCCTSSFVMCTKYNGVSVMVLVEIWVVFYGGECLLWFIHMGFHISMLIWQCHELLFNKRHLGCSFYLVVYFSSLK